MLKEPLVAVRLGSSPLLPFRNGRYITNCFVNLIGEYIVKFELAKTTGCMTN